MSSTGVQGLIDGVLDGAVRSISRAISVIEDNDPRAFELLKALFPHTGRAHVIGVTGPPGAGKSTLTDRLITAWRARGKRIGVLAVDPTSPFSGGAILGDRVRMSRHYNDPDVSIRSMATRGALGGVSRSTYDAVTVLEAAGMDAVIIETVGVGQDEIDIVNTAHTSAVMLIPGMGDEVQAIKAGILEIGDLFIINKADRDGVDRLRTELNMMLGLAAEHQPDGWRPPVLTAVATSGDGVEAIVQALENHHTFLQSTSEGRAREVSRTRHRIRQLWKDAAMERLLARLMPEEELQRAAERIAERTAEPFSLIEGMLKRLRLD